MTVKVLETLKFTTTCGRCGSKLEYEYSDMGLHTISDYTGSTDTCKAIVCPVCSTLAKVM